jgi:hypothetical protein
MDWQASAARTAHPCAAHPRKRTLHDNDVLAARGRTCQLDARLDGLGARVPEKDGVQRRIGEGQLGQQSAQKGNVGGRVADVDLSDRERGSQRQTG